MIRKTGCSRTHASLQAISVVSQAFQIVDKLLKKCKLVACTDNVKMFFFQVAQYIKLEIPVLDSFVQKLQEEEEREIKKLTRK